MRAVTAEPGGEAAPGTGEGGGFEVHLDVFEGPFDLLLGLISKHKLDITEVALSQVTDEFIAYIRALRRRLGPGSGQLLPAGRGDPARPEGGPAAAQRARSRTRKTSPCWRPGTCCSPGCCSTAPTRRSRRSSRAGCRCRAAGSPGGCRWSPSSPSCSRRSCSASGAAEFAAIAARALTPRPVPEVSTEHLHAPTTTVREQADILAAQLSRLGRATFRRLSADCSGTYEVVARFLAAARALPGR